MYVQSDQDNGFPGLSEAFAGQSVGLCGAAVPGVLWLITGLHTGNIAFDVEVHDEEPALDPVWEDVVEVSFHPVSESTGLAEWAGEAAWDLNLTRTDYRVRYCAQGMDEARNLDTRASGEPQADSYLLQFWPAPPRADRVIRQTSQHAAYWHDYARELPPPPPHRSSEPRPNHALDTVGSDVQRAVALLAARRACGAAGLLGVSWIGQALTALAEGRTLPPPFDDPDRMWETLSSDPQVPSRSVLEAIPSERPPYRPPTSPEAAGLAPLPAEKPGDNRPAGWPLGRGLGALIPPAPADDGPTPTGGGGHITMAVHTSRTPHGPLRISQPYIALPAVLAAADPDPLKAALDAVWAAVNTYGEHYLELLEEIRSACTLVRWRR
ncbi:hypothetical protein [Streptomyces sp. NPDC056883]|uniref:hypothetical protein n=1 Tax=Streptomyces sp. NPDC056883 TaxID=3345959 RepID=UPI0036BC9CC2